MGLPRQLFFLIQLTKTGRVSVKYLYTITILSILIMSGCSNNESKNDLKQENEKLKQENEKLSIVKEE